MQGRLLEVTCLAQTLNRGVQPSRGMPHTKTALTSDASAGQGLAPYLEKAGRGLDTQGYPPTHARDAPCVPCAPLRAARPGRAVRADR